MSASSTLKSELAAINKDLVESFDRLKSLLEKTRKDLESNEIKSKPAEREHLETVVMELEQKLKELKEIGIRSKL